MTDTLSDEGLSAWRQFLGLHAKVTAAIEQDPEAAGVVPLGWYDVLYALSQAPGRALRMHQLADAVVLSRSGLTRLVDRLDKSDLVRREPCPEDRRGQHAVLTDAGRAALRKAWPVYARSIQRQFGQYLNRDEARRLEQLLSAVLEHHF